MIENKNRKEKENKMETRRILITRAYLLLCVSTIKKERDTITNKHEIYNLTTHQTYDPRSCSDFQKAQLLTCEKNKTLLNKGNKTPIKN